MAKNKRGPKPTYNFETLDKGVELYIDALKLPSFRVTLSNFNKNFGNEDDKHVYQYEQSGRKIKAIRVQ